MSGRNGMLHYQVEIKQDAVYLVLEGHMRYVAVAEKLNIRKADRIKAWVRMYRRERELSFHKPIGRPLKAESAEREVERLHMENALLKKIPYRIAERVARAAQSRAIYHHKEEYTVKAMCKFFGVSRAAYYAWDGKLADADPDQERMQKIQAVYEASHKSYGYRRITSQAYHVLVGEYNITPSLSRRGNCWDKAPMENFFGHLKEEYSRQFKQTTFKDTQQLIDEYIYFYNYERIQLKTKQTPFETRCLSI